MNIIIDYCNQDIMCENIYSISSYDLLKFYLNDIESWNLDEFEKKNSKK